jgi:hypothetical protein
MDHTFDTTSLTALTALLLDEAGDGAGEETERLVAPLAALLGELRASALRPVPADVAEMHLAAMFATAPASPPVPATPRVKIAPPAAPRSTWARHRTRRAAVVAACAGLTLGYGALAAAGAVPAATSVAAHVRNLFGARSAPPPSLAPVTAAASAAPDAGGRSTAPHGAAGPGSATPGPQATPSSPPTGEPRSSTKPAAAIPAGTTPAVNVPTTAEAAPGTPATTAPDTIAPASAPPTTAAPATGTPGTTPATAPANGPNGAHGKSATAPGHTGATPGKGSGANGPNGSNGNSATAPGHTGAAPGANGTQNKHATAGQ